MALLRIVNPTRSWIQRAVGSRRQGKPGPVGRVAVVAHEVRKDRGHYREERLRGRPARTAVADDQRVDLEHVLVLAREQTHRIVLAGSDPPNPCEGEPAHQYIGVRQAQDLELAVPHRLDKALCVFVDDHGPEVEFAALELDELLVQSRGRQGEPEPRERGEHLARDVFGTAADGPDPDARAPQVRQRLDLVGTPAKEDE
jgi:hypothetical protein